MRQEDSADNFMFNEIFQLENSRYIHFEPNNKDFFNCDFLNIDHYFEDFKEAQKIEIESTFQIQFPDSLSSMSIPNENFSKETKLNIDQSIAQKNQSIKKNNDRKKKPDYKKNICGYITKTVVKQASSLEMKPVIRNICKKYHVEPQDFYLTYRGYENITGPTHLYGLLTPRLQKLDKQQSVKEINIRIVFLTYYKWFIRHRYLRYIMVQGKMERKDQYLQYKNRELLFIITEEWKNLLQQLKKYLKNNKNQKIDGNLTKDYIQAKYDELLEQNVVKFDEKEFRDFCQQISKQTQSYIISDKIQQEIQQKIQIKQIAQTWQDKLFDQWNNEQY